MEYLQNVHDIHLNGEVNCQNQGVIGGVEEDDEDYYVHYLEDPSSNIIRQYSQQVVLKAADVFLQQWNFFS